jgi:hypothetical protein
MPQVTMFPQEGFLRTVGGWLMSLLAATAGCGELREEMISEDGWGGCTDPDGYVIRERVEFLEPRCFTGDWLEAHYRSLAREKEPTEMYVFSHSDPALEERLEVGRLILFAPSPPPEGYANASGRSANEGPHEEEYQWGPRPLKWSGAAAHFFKVGNNAFFQYSDEEGRIHWRVIEGRNVLHGEIAPAVHVIFVGQTLWYYPSPESRRKARAEGVPVENPCSEGHRAMHFVVRDWNKTVIRRLANHYDALFAVPESLNLFFSSTYGMAAVSGQSVSFPSLEAAAAGYADLYDPRDGRRAYFRRVRDSGRIVERGFVRLDP